MIASKYDEIDDNIPFIRDFKNASSRSNFTWEQVTHCEDKILKLLDWELVALSPENFTSTFLSFGILFSDDNLPGS